MSETVVDQGTTKHHQNGIDALIAESERINAESDAIELARNSNRPKFSERSPIDHDTMVTELASDISDSRFGEPAETPLGTVLPTPEIILSDSDVAVNPDFRDINDRESLDPDEPDGWSTTVAETASSATESNPVNHGIDDSSIIRDIDVGDGKGDTLIMPPGAIDTTIVPLPPDTVVATPPDLPPVGPGTTDPGVGAVVPEAVFDKAVGIVNYDSQVAGQIDLTAEQVLDMTNKRREGESAVKHWFRNLVRGGVLRGYYKSRLQTRYREVVEVGGVVALQGAYFQEFKGYSPETAELIAEDEMRVELGRVLDSSGQLLLAESGEKQMEISDNPDVVNQFKTSLNEIVIRYSQGSLDEMGFNSEVDQLIYGFQGLNPELVDKGSHYAHNLLEIAQTARGYIESGMHLDQVKEGLEKIEIRGAVMHEASNTKIRRSAFDRLQDRVIESRYSGTAVGSAVLLAGAVGLCLTKRGAMSGFSAALRATGVGFIAAGVIAGFNKSWEFRHKVAQLRRSETLGINKDTSPDTGAEKLQPLVYEAMSASDAINQLNSLIDTDGNLTSMADKDIIFARAKSTSIRELLRAGGDRGIDLISYEDVDVVSQQRFELMLSLAKVEKALNSKIAEGGTIKMEGIDGIERDVEIAVAMDRIKAEVETLIGFRIDAQQTDIERKYKIELAKQVLIAGAIGGVSGVVIGALAQEISAAVLPGVIGLIDGHGHSVAGNPNTFLETALHGDHVKPVGTGGGAAEIIAGGHMHVIHHGGINLKVPEGFTAHFETVDGRHVAELVDNKGNVVAEGLTFNKAGEITNQSHKLLESAGIKLTEHTDIIKGEPKIVGVDEYSKINHDLLERHATHLQMNDTPNLVDYNEFNFQAGGHDGSYFDSKGNVVLRMDGLDPNGSWQGNERVNPIKAIHNGTFKAFMSPKGGKDWNEFFVFTAEEHNGHVQVVIPKGHPATELFMHGGDPEHSNFAGMYLGSGVLDEKSGAIDVVNSIHGAEHESGFTVIPNKIVTTTRLDFPPAPVIVQPETVDTIPIFGPPLIIPGPNVGRKREREPVPFPYYGGSGLEQVATWLRNNPERLKTRKQITSPDGVTTWQEADGRPVERNSDRERSVINEYIERERKINPAHIHSVETIASSMKPMDEKCRVAINVPAWMESKNLNSWLEQFTTQLGRDGKPLSPEIFEINVIVNRKTGDAPDDSVAVIEAFISEYTRIHGNTPRVNYYDIEIDPPNNNVGYARKLITDATLLRSTQRSRQDGCLYIESEDADVVHASPHTVINLIRKFDSNPHLDAVRGIQDRYPDQLKENDYLFMRRRAWDFFELLARQKRFRDPTKPAWHYTWNRTVTGGWNTGYTAEVYADIDGYDSRTAGEDMLIGEKISAIRGDGTTPNLETIGTVGTRSDSSPRRFILEIINGQGAYEDFMSEEANKKIREMSISELMSRISTHARLSESNSADFSNFINIIPIWTRSVTVGSSSESDAMTERILFMLGFKKGDYRFDGSRIDIDNWSNFADALNRYRIRFDTRSATAATATA